MTIEEMKAKKIEYGMTGEMIAKASGIPLGTVQKIFSGATKAPRKQTIDALEKVFLSRSAKKVYSYPACPSPAAFVVREPAENTSLAEKAVIHTLDDYYALPEDRRAELIDGIFYDMSAPSRLHQMILVNLCSLFLQSAEEHGLLCEVYPAPCDVRLDRDDYTMVQPDILVVCDYDNPDIRRIEGAPDLTVEILSPATRMKDMVLKLHKYQNAGVREYWIVDPKKKTVTVHYFEEEDYSPKNYDFRSIIPVQISEGNCRIDFSLIERKLAIHGW